MKRLIYVLFIFLIYSCSEKEEIETQTCEEGCFKIISKTGANRDCTLRGSTIQCTYTFNYLIQYECDGAYRDVYSKTFQSSSKAPQVNERLCDIKLISNYP